MKVKNYSKTTSKNATIRFIVFFLFLAFFIFIVGFCVNNDVVEKPKDVHRYEVKLSNWLGHTIYECSWYERTDQGTYILYSEDSTMRKEIDVGAGWKIEITNIK